MVYFPSNLEFNFLSNHCVNLQFCFVINFFFCQIIAVYKLLFYISNIILPLQLMLVKVEKLN